MSIDIQYNVLGESKRKQILSFILDNEYLTDFSVNDTASKYTDRKAFSVTYIDRDLPEILCHYKSSRYNVYNFIGIETINHGDLPTHEDDDLFCHLRDQGAPDLYNKLPEETTVYYAQICETMQGGNLCCEDTIITPVQDMLVTFSSNEPHSVTSVEQTNKSRVCLVCEKYKLLPMAFKYIQVGQFRSG